MHMLKPVSDKGHHNWYLAYGVSSHISNQLVSFVEFTALRGPVRIGGTNSLIVEGIETVVKEKYLWWEVFTDTAWSALCS